MSVRLFGFWRSSTSYRLRIALNLKGLAYENVPVNLRAREQQDKAFTARNPFGGLPMLEAAGRDRAQSMAILEWLDEAYPQAPRLLPADIEQRFTARELAYAIATEVHAPLNLKTLQYLKNELGQEQPAIDAWAHRWMGQTLGAIEARLEQLGTGDFLFDAPGLFEAVLVPQLYNARRFAFDLSAMRRMTRIEEACMALASFEQAHPRNQPDAA